jgi:hypothetical protein
MTTSSQQTVDNWVPGAVVDAANRLHAKFVEQDSEEGLKVLSRLISDPRMQAVWQLLYSKKRDEKYKSTDVFAYPVLTLKSKAENLRRQASEILKNGGKSGEIDADWLDAEANAAWDAHAKAEKAFPGLANDTQSQLQDRGVVRFFDYACRSALNITPSFLSDIEWDLKRVSAVCAALRVQKTELFELGLWDEAAKLREIIEQCEHLLDLQLESIHSDDPIIIARKRGDPEIRTYVVQLYELGFALFGTPLYGTLATIANVVFNCETVTGPMVRDWLP